MVVSTGFIVKVSRKKKPVEAFKSPRFIIVKRNGVVIRTVEVGQ